MSTRPERRVGVVALALMASLVLGACGGPSKEADAKAATESAAKTASKGKGTAPIRFGFSAWPGWFPWQVADEKGFFKRAGLDVKLTYFESYTDSLNALAGGQLDANTQTLNDTISSVAGGAEEVVVLVNDNSTGNDQIIVGPDINSVTDLKGKKVGAEEGTVDHFLLLQGLDRAGLSQKDIAFQPLATDAAAAAFAAGQLDAVGVFAPFTTKALERPGAKALFTSKDFPGAIPDHLVVSKAMVDSRPDDVAKLVGVWFETLAYIKANPAEATTIMAKRAGVSTDDYRTYDQGTRIFTLEENLAAFSPGSDMTHLDFAAATISAFLKGAGLLDKEPKLTGLLESRFVKAKAGNG